MSINRRMTSLVGGNPWRLIHRFLVLTALLVSGTVYSQEWIYTVRPDDNLWNITAEHLVRMDYWPKLQAMNHITDPHHLPPGLKLRIPVAWLKRLPSSAQVLHVQGEVKALRASGQTVIAQPGLALESGDTLYTGAKSNVTVEFTDGSQALLQADSQLVLDQLGTLGETRFADTQLHLRQGRVESAVASQKNRASRYEISTPAASSAVRGTRYRIGMDPTSETARTEVLEGAIAFHGAQQTQKIPKGFGTLAEAGQAPSPPVALLRPPNVAELPPVVTRVPIQIPIPVVAGAVAYRAQIAPDARFDTLLFDGTSSSPAVRGPDLPDGNYALRVRGLDARGIEGHDAQHLFRLHARPEPPFLIQPSHDSAILASSLAFEWSEPSEAASYHLQLAADEKFTTLLLDQPDYSKSRLKPAQAPEPGHYYWRVAVRDAAGRQGPFSDPQAFRLQPTPQMESPEVTEDTITFRWSAALPGQQYDFQLAKDVNFEDIRVSTRTPEPQVVLPRPASGFHYLRIRVIDTDGQVGPFGPAQRIDIPAISYWPLGMVVILTVLLAL